ncbi:HAMP domain-containing sensor histidine kinase [Niabella insulamsoli]|uniref:sensor histidine kinase n=1 Tax=Niabella insulamsoli TaxID=3144874 RepID=UPI0031FC164E
MHAYWNWLVGKKEDFTLEARIFHAICLAVMLCLTISVPINYLLQLPELCVVLTLFVLLTALLYYISRFKGRYKASVAVFQFFVAAALIANYYFNSGMNGPTYAMFLLTFVVSVVISPPRQYALWLSLNVALIAALMTLEWVRPGVIEQTYQDTTGRYIDLLFSYVALAAFAFLIAGYVRKAYNRQREELVAQAAALEEANHTKNKLLSILGHDLKEPLASLQGYLELLADFDLEEHERHDMNARLLTMTKNTSLMLSNILAWTKSQGHNFTADMQKLFVNEALHHVVELTKSISQKKEISFAAHLPEDLAVKADSQMLALVVRNLLMNAIKFTPTNGNIYLSAHLDGNTCTIIVKDDGIGIPSSLQNRIFSIDSGSRRGTASEKGTGLGLMLCKEFTAIMEGDLSFESAADHGTTFYLKLPAVTLPMIQLDQKQEDLETLQLWN